MQTAARSTQRFYVKILRQRNAWSAVSRAPGVVVVQQIDHLLAHSDPLLRHASGLSKAHGSLSHQLQSSQSHLVQSSRYSDVQGKAKQIDNLSEDACPQGIQGDDCVIFKLWLENCRRYGLANCNEQMQGIQSGRKTLAEVLVDQEELIEEIADQYRAASHKPGTYSNFQGLQDSVPTLLPADFPCPQGVQGYECAQFKIWLENCHRFGLHDCAKQLDSWRAGKKSLAEVFAEQDKTIREAATVAYQKLSRQRRKYSTSSRHQGSGSGDPPGGVGQPEGGQLTQRQKLQRAVKEYGSTVIVFHVTISLMSLGFFYLLVSSGIDIVGLLMKLGIGEAFLQNKLAAGTGTFVVAYAVHKVFAPVRIATTLTATPFIVRYLRRVGFLRLPQHSKPKQE